MRAQPGVRAMNNSDSATRFAGPGAPKLFSRAIVSGVVALGCTAAGASSAVAASECVNPYNGVIMSPLGDVNGDGAVNVIDAHCSIIVSLWELGGMSGPAPSCAAQPLSKADVNCSGNINVIDVNILITLALNQPLSSGLDPTGSGCVAPCQALGYVPLPMVLPIYSDGTSTGGGFTLHAIGTGAATSGSSASPGGGNDFEVKPKSEGIPQEIP